jgi:hypothetical protein
LAEVMKKIFTVLGIFIYASAIGQTTKIVDNNFNAPTGPHIYSTIQAAANAANAGDTIQIQPSPNAYGNVTINKPLVLVGIGFNVVKDIPLTSVMGNISLANNADNTSNASGTVITGLQFGILYPGGKVGANYTLDNVKVYNCRFDYAFANTDYALITNMEIYDCYTTGQYTRDASLYFLNRVSNSLFRNNLMLYGIYLGSSTPGTNTISNNILYGRIGVFAEGTNTNIINNNFIGAANSTYAFEAYLRDCIVSYNIFYGPTPSIAASGSTSVNYQRNVFTFNLVHATGDQTLPPRGGAPGGNSGEPNYTGSPEFLNVQLLNTWSSAYDYSLGASSPALLANIPATDNPQWDIGITGGSYPWIEANFSLQTTALPVIEILNTTTIINPGDNLPVRVKVKSN